MQNSKLFKFTGRVLKHPLFGGSLVMVAGINFYNFGQFVYHFISGRLLGRVYYGDLAAIISILGLVSIFEVSFGLTVVKFIASSKNKNETANFIKWFNLWSLYGGVLMAALSFLLAPFLIEFLNLRQSLALYVLSPLFWFAVVTYTQRSILQGLLSFGRFVLSLFLESVVKIAATVALVLAGMLVFGAMLGMLASAVVSLLFTWFSLKGFLAGKRGKMPNIRPLLKYSLPVFVQGLAFTSLYSTDLILVKHFFAADQAGIYASLAVLGRVALFLSAPVSQFMFPVVAQRFSRQERYHKVFYLALILAVLMTLPIIGAYYLFPKLIIEILYGSQFIEGAGFLWLFGLSMGILSLATLLAYFYFSLGKTVVVFPFVFAATLQAILIWFIHPDILTVIRLSIISNALLVLVLFVYFLWHDRKAI